MNTFLVFDHPDSGTSLIAVFSNPPHMTHDLCLPVFGCTAHLHVYMVGWIIHCDWPIKLASGASKHLSNQLSQLHYEPRPTSSYLMTTSIHRLDSIVTRYSSTNSGPSNLSPNSLTEGSLPGEHTARSWEGYGGGKVNLLVSVCTMFMILLPQTDANRHVASGLPALAGINGISEGMANESGEQGKRR